MRIPLAILALAAPAAAQSFTPDSIVSYSLTYDDIGPGGTNHNGEIEPGEGALLRLTVSFSNQNTVGTFAPPVGPYSSGTIRGFGGAFIDLIGTGGADGNWDTAPAHGYGVMPPWNIVGPPGNGVPAANGAQLTQVQFGQFVFMPIQVNTTNPISQVFTALWTPSSFAGRWVTFTVASSAAAGTLHSQVLFETSPTSLAGAYCNANFGSVMINVGIPAPSSLALLAVGAAFAARRRR